MSLDRPCVQGRLVARGGLCWFENDADTRPIQQAVHGPFVGQAAGAHVKATRDDPVGDWVERAWLCGPGRTVSTISERPASGRDWRKTCRRRGGEEPGLLFFRIGLNENETKFM
jgi:hypothetical protein